MNTETETLTDDQVEKAVNWWADAISHPRFDNGDPSEVGGITMTLAIMATQPVSDEQKARFKESLEKRLRTGSLDYGMCFGVDYHPDGILADAMSEASIPESQAPWKTQMWFRGGKVIVSYGYGAPRVTLEEEEERA